VQVMSVKRYIHARRQPLAGDQSRADSLGVLLDPATAASIWVGFPTSSRV
jgi:hypothetical protein